MTVRSTKTPPIRRKHVRSGSRSCTPERVLSTRLHEWKNVPVFVRVALNLANFFRNRLELCPSDLQLRRELYGQPCDLPCSFLLGGPAMLGRRRDA